MSVSTFPGDETHAQVEESIRGADIYVVQPTCPPTNDHLMELLVIIDAVKRAFCPANHRCHPLFRLCPDRIHKSTGREPISAKLVANLLTTAGANRVVAVESARRADSRFL